MLRTLATALAAVSAATLMAVGPASAFCGFYVGAAGASLYNDASKVVLVRDGQKTTITMANDFAGNVSNFAMVIPVPAVPQREDIRTVPSRIIDQLDAYSAPRLVEYFDADPCAPKIEFRMAMATAMPETAAPGGGRDSALGVTIEAQYAVGEYDILILSAQQSAGLLTWLTANGYQVPVAAQSVLADYIAGGMKFFVARVALDRIVQRPDGSASYLSPLQIRMTSSQLMLPIRLGLVNARGPQELFIYALTRQGRVESINYDNRRLPSDQNVPPFTELLFPDFYRALFDRQVAAAPRPTLFTEYAWDLSWCDPCAANPPATEDLVTLGLDWLTGTGNGQPLQPRLGQPGTPQMVMPPQPIEAFITRLHLRYSPERFRQDLLFRVTDDRENYQGRYVMQQPFQGPITCSAGDDYLASLEVRRAQERGALNALTGWPLDYIAEQQRRYPGKPKQP